MAHVCVCLLVCSCVQCGGVVRDTGSSACVCVCVRARVYLCVCMCENPCVACGALQVSHIKGHVQFSLMVEVKELHQVHEQEEALCPFPPGHVRLCLVP